MHFHIANNTGLYSENYGPFEYESVKLVEQAGDDFARKKRLLPLHLDPVVPDPQLLPAYVPFLGEFLFILKTQAAKEELEFFAGAIMTSAQVSGWGDYYVLHGPTIENRFLESLDITRSTFELVNRATLTLSPTTPWDVIEEIKEVRSTKELFARKHHPSLKKLVVSVAYLKRKWPGNVFVFDRRVYFSSDLLRHTPGLERTDARCDLQQLFP